MASATPTTAAQEARDRTSAMPRRDEEEQDAREDAGSIRSNRNSSAHVQNADGSHGVAALLSRESAREVDEEDDASTGTHESESHTESEPQSSDEGGEEAGPHHRPLVWWKRILIDARYRAEVTRLATACYRQELHVLEEHPFLLSSHPTLPSDPASSPAAAPSSSSKVFPPARTQAQFVCVPAAADGTVALWNAATGAWEDVCLGALCSVQQRSEKAAPTQPVQPPAAAAASIRMHDDSEGVFSFKHPEAIIRQSALASKQRAQPGHGMEEPRRDDAPVYCSPEARRQLRPLSPRSRQRLKGDTFDRLYGGGIDGVRRLCAALDTPAYRAFYNEGYVAEVLEAQREAVRRQRPRQQQQQSGKRHAVSSRLPSLSSHPHEGAASHATQRKSAVAHGWASPPRTQREIAVDNVLGLSHVWRGVLPPSGFIRLVPDPRTAMWGDTFAEEEDRRRRLCPKLREHPTPTELLEEPTGFHKIIADTYCSPLCIHIFREKQRTTTKSAATAAAAAAKPAPAHITRGRQARSKSSPADVYDYLGTYRQSLLLVHVKVYCRALHEQQQQQHARLKRRVVKDKLDSGSTRAEGEQSSPERAPEPDEAVIDGSSEASQSCTLEATAEDAPPAPSPAVPEASEKTAVACPVLLHGVPEVAFPVLKVATAPRTHDPLASTSLFAINRAAAFLKHAAGRGERGAPVSARTRAATAWSHPVAGALSPPASAAAPLLPPGTWMGLVATPRSQPPAVAFAAARVWRQLHRHSRAAREAVKAVFQHLPRDAEGCLGKAAFVAFILGLLSMFFPTHLAAAAPVSRDRCSSAGAARRSIHEEIAEEEWVYRGTTENMSFPAFFEKFFGFPFIFYRDLASVTERDYVDFWEVVKVGLFKDVTLLVPALTARAAQRAAEQLPRRAHVDSSDGGPTLDGAASAHEQRTEEETLLSLIDSRAGHGHDGSHRQQQQQQQRSLPAADGASGPAEQKPPNTRRDPRLDGRQSVLYVQRLSHNQPSAAARPPFAELTTKQLHTLFMTDYTHPTPARLACPTRWRGGGLSDAAPATAAAVVEEGNDAGRRGAASSTLSSMEELGAEAVRSSGSEADAEGKCGVDSGSSARAFEPALVDGLDDNADLLPGDHQDMLAALLKNSVHYKRRHAKLKTECLNNIAVHNGVTSTWELYKEEVYGAAEEGQCDDGVRDVAEDAATAALLLSNAPASPVSSMLPSLSFPGAPSRGSSAALRGVQPTRTRDGGAVQGHPIDAAAPPSTTRAQVRSFGSRSVQRSTCSTAAVQAAPPRGRGGADDEMDRLLRFIADIPDEVFTDTHVSVRERFKTHEASQRARDRHL